MLMPDVTTAQNHRSICWAERGTLLLLVIYMCLHTLPLAWRSLITDFPNYYMSARLVHEGYDTSRMYEWDWLQREKDHRAVDVRVIGLIPITPLSTLVMLPVAGLKPLAAKHAWILFNLTLLVPLGWLLHSMTGLTYRRIALTFALSVPLYRNLEFGQFYVFLLLLIIAACWAYLRKYYVWAGALIAIAAACKIFPVLFFIFFLQRRSWRTLVSRSGHRADGRCRICLDLWLERASHVSARDSALGPARRRSAAVYGGGLHLRRAALSISL